MFGKDIPRQAQLSSYKRIASELPRGSDIKKLNLPDRLDFTVEQSVVQFLLALAPKYFGLGVILKLSVISKTLRSKLSNHLSSDFNQGLHLVARALPLRFILKVESKAHKLTLLTHSKEGSINLNSLKLKTEKLTDFFQKYLLYSKSEEENTTEPLRNTGKTLLSELTQIDPADISLEEICLVVLAFVVNEGREVAMAQCFLGDLYHQGFLNFGLLFPKNNKEYQETLSLLLANNPKKDIFSFLIQKPNFAFCFAVNYIRTTKILSNLMNALPGIESSVITFIKNLTLQELLLLIFRNTIYSLTVLLFKTHELFLMKFQAGLQSLEIASVQLFSAYVAELTAIFREILTVEPESGANLIALSGRLKKLTNQATYPLLQSFIRNNLDPNRLISLDDNELFGHILQINSIHSVPSSHLELFSTSISAREECIVHETYQNNTAFAISHSNENATQHSPQIPSTSTLPVPPSKRLVWHTFFSQQFTFDFSRPSAPDGIQRHDHEIVPSGHSKGSVGRFISVTEKDIVKKSQSSKLKSSSPENSIAKSKLSKGIYNKTLKYILDSPKTKLYEIQNLLNDFDAHSPCKDLYFLDVTWTGKGDRKGKVNLTSLLNNQRIKLSLTEAHFASSEDHFMGYLLTMIDYKNLLSFFSIKRSISPILLEDDYIKKILRMRLQIINLNTPSKEASSTKSTNDDETNIYEDQPSMAFTSL